MLAQTYFFFADHEAATARTILVIALTRAKPTTPMPSS